MIQRTIDRLLGENASLRYGTWRQRWFPYRTWEYDFEKMGLKPARWQWPDLLGRPFR